MHEAIKDVFGPMFEAIQAKWRIISVTSSKSEKTTENRRLFREETQNVAGRSIPRDRAAEFESMLIPKYKRNEIDRKGDVLARNEYPRYLRLA